MLRSQIIGQNVKGHAHFKFLVQGAGRGGVLYSQNAPIWIKMVSNCSFWCSKSVVCYICWDILDSWGQSSAFKRLYCYKPKLTFDWIKLLQDDLVNIAKFFYDLLHQTEQFETIFNQLQAFWEFDPMYKKFEECAQQFIIQTSIVKQLEVGSLWNLEAWFLVPIIVTLYDSTG